MQVNATYENGAINFAQTLRFKHRKFEVIVNIPEDEVESDSQAQPSLDTLLAQTPDGPWLQRMKAIETRVLATPDSEIPESGESLRI